MTTLREAAQQALEALQAYGSHAPNCDHLMLLTSLPPQRKPCSCGLGANITALRAALAEQVAEDAKQMQRDLRDRIATAAMQGLLSNPQLKNQILKTGGADGLWIESSAYGWADGMLKEREKNRR